MMDTYNSKSTVFHPTKHRRGHEETELHSSLDSYENSYSEWKISSENSKSSVTDNLSIIDRLSEDELFKDHPNCPLTRCPKNNKNSDSEWKLSPDNCNSSATDNLSIIDRLSEDELFTITPNCPLTRCPKNSKYRYSVWELFPENSLSRDQFEIQGHPRLDDKLSVYRKFHGHNITKPFDGEKVQMHIQVMVPDLDNNDDNKYQSWGLGTIISVHETTGEIKVAWEREGKEGTFVKEDNNQYRLLLVDNALSGVHHSYVGCSECEQDPLLGIRWKCLVCTDYNLCTKCYMGDMHRIDHRFLRIISKDSKGVQMPPRWYGRRIQKHVWLKIPKVSTIKELTNKRKQEDKSVCPTNTIELTGYYPDHLPLLGKYSDGYVNIIFKSTNKRFKNKAIRVDVWRNIQRKRKKKLKSQPSLYLIFASSENDERVNKVALMTQVIDFAAKTKLPCHIVGQKVLFHSGSTTNACIHYRTNKNTFEELVIKGFRKFARGDIAESEDENDEIAYFKRMAEYATGDDVLPVIISLRKGAEKVQESANKSLIPIIRLEKSTTNVYVSWTRLDDRDQLDNTEHKSDTRFPWRVKKAGAIGKSDEISLISEIRCDLETLVCSLIIGVHMEIEAVNNHIIKEDFDYLNVLSVYLLKKQKWNIPKKHIYKTLGQISLEYIYERVITSDFINELWKSFSKMGYRRPPHEDYEADAACSTTTSEDSKEENEKRQNGSSENNFQKQGQRIKLTEWNSDCFGFLFIALLQKHFRSGATQLVETGYIGINHILLGCAILEDEANNLKTTPQLKEQLQRLANAFADRAILITTCIYDAEERRSWTAATDSGVTIDTEQRDDTNHAGRLLLNHGYLRNAIETQNKTYLENGTVKKILNELWFGTRENNWTMKTTLKVSALAALHLFVLPLLMINSTRHPLRWLYKTYKLPFMKVLVQMMGFFFLLIAYASMLLFDYDEDGISNSDWFIIAWMASFFVDEVKQVMVAIIRKKWIEYERDWWNRLDWLLIMVYVSGMLLRVGKGSGFLITSKCLLVFAFLLLCIRLLNLCCMTEFLGPKLVIIRKMAKHTIAFMLIMTVIMVWYSVTLYALLYPNTEFSFKQIEQILSRGYWMLFGELGLDGDTLTVPYCTFNRTIYEHGALQRCPSTLGLYLTPYLKAFYGLIAVVLLLNLLIAMYSDIFEDVQRKSKFYWSQMQTDFLEEYSIKPIFPVHLQILALPGLIVSMFWFCCTCCRKKQDPHCYPWFVEVFLYDAKYDMRLKSTDEAEKKGLLEAAGKIDINDDETITMMERLQKIEEDLKDLKKIKQKFPRKQQTPLWDQPRQYFSNDH